MRILLVSPGNNRKYGGGFYYSFNRRLMNGFIRAGHFVYPYSDRDTADYALGLRPLGRRIANRRLLEIGRELQPDVVVLLLSYLIDRETVAEMRQSVPGLKVAAVCIDDIGHDNPAGQFRRLMLEADAGFATTGGEILKRFAGDIPVAFIPNPVDLSIDCEVSADAQAHEFDVFFAGHQPGVDRRWDFVAGLRAKVRQGVRFGVFGRHRDDVLSGAEYVRALGRAKIGLNLNRRDGDLYASDRMAQFLGNGLLLATPRASGYGDYFDEDQMMFFDDGADLAAQIDRALADDVIWRARARAGRARALSIMGETAVARFMLNIVKGENPDRDWAFGKHIYSGMPAMAVH